MHPIIPQIVGFIAVILFLLSYQQKTRKNIIICNVLSRLLYILQYILLGAISGAVLDILGALSSVIAERKDSRLIKKYKGAAFVAVSLMIAAAGIFICVKSGNPLDLLPIAGVLLHTGAFWISNERTIRIVSLLGSPFWLVYNFASAAYGSAVGDLLSMASILIAMVKYRDFAKRDKKSEPEKE